MIIIICIILAVNSNHQWQIELLPVDLESAYKMDNFYTTIELLCTFLRFFGFFPQHLESRASGRSLKVTKLSVFQTIFGVGLIFTLITGNIVHFYVYKIYETDFLNNSVWSYILMLGCISVFIQCLFQLYNMDKIKRLFESMHRLDEKFSKNFIFIDHSRQRKVVRNVSMFLIILISLKIPMIIAVYGLLLEIFTFEIIVLEVLFCFLLLYECLFCLQFIIPTYLLRERFKVLKNFLR